MVTTLTLKCSTIGVGVTFIKTMTMIVCAKTPVAATMTATWHGGAILRQTVDMGTAAPGVAVAVAVQVDAAVAGVAVAVAMKVWEEVAAGVQPIAEIACPVSSAGDSGPGSVAWLIPQ